MSDHWLLQTIILGYAGLVTLLAGTGAFAYTPERRDAACKVLRLLLPWGVIEVIMHRPSPQDR